MEIKAESEKRPKRKRARVPISVSLHQEVVDELERLAKQQRRSRSNLVEYIVQQYLDAAASPAPAAEEGNNE